MIEPDKKKQCDVKRYYTQSLPNDLISTTAHKVFEERSSARTERLI